MHKCIIHLYILFRIRACSHIKIYIHILSLLSRFYSLLRTNAYQLTFGLSFTSLHTEVKGHPVKLGMTCGQHVDSSAVFGSIDQIFKSTIIQIVHDSGVGPILPAGDRNRDRCVQGNDSTSASQWRIQNIYIIYIYLFS